MKEVGRVPGIYHPVFQEEIANGLTVTWTPLPVGPRLGPPEPWRFRSSLGEFPPFARVQGSLSVSEGFPIHPRDTQYQWGHYCKLPLWEVTWEKGYLSCMLTLWNSADTY